MIIFEDLDWLELLVPAAAARSWSSEGNTSFSFEACLSASYMATNSLYVVKLNMSSKLSPLVSDLELSLMIKLSHAR